jgi:PAS domain S-box-containing protein
MRAPHPAHDSVPPDTDFQFIAESVPHIVWMAGQDGSTEYVNRQGREYTGFPRGTDDGWDLPSLGHPDDAERAKRGWEEAIRAETPFDLQYRIRRADGEFRWHACRASPVRGADGQTVKWIGTATDVEDQKSLEDHLRQAERESAESLILLETLQATAPVGFGFVDRRLRLLRVNGTLAAINGASVEEHIGRTVAQVMPELWPQVAPLLQDVLETGRPVVNGEIVGAIAAAPGEMRCWLMSCYPVLVDGEVVGIGVVVVDVTERRQADEFRSVVMANMAEGVCAVDAEGCLTFMNAAASRMLGWSERELRGKPVHAAIHFQHADGSPFPGDECELHNTQTQHRTVRIADDAFTRKDGSIFPVAYSAAPLLSGADFHGVVAVFRDTSEEKAEQEHMKRELDALTWVGRTRDALDEGRLILYSQPIVPLTGGEPSEELLLRMVGRDGEIIRPASFLPAAEKYGLIGEIDRWVVTQAARLAASGRRVQANLSAVSISSLDLLPLIESEVREAGADPSDIAFELTETALMQGIEAGEAFARGLTEIGSELALDDFGTGFGSFTYLKKLPIDYLKIDSEFVRELVSNTANQHVVKAIIALAKGFGQQTIAEGVEDRETLALLRDYRVDFAQGYYLGRPAPLQADAGLRTAGGPADRFRAPRRNGRGVGVTHQPARASEHSSTSRAAGRHGG